MGRFDDAINNFNQRKLDSLIPVSNTHRFLWKNFEQPNPEYDFKQRPRRQDIVSSARSFIETGSFYIFKNSKFMEIKNRICGKYGLYLTPEDEAFDIDSELDFTVCEALLNSNNDRTVFAA